MSATLDLAKQLIKLESVTPNDGGCQEILAARLDAIGFNIQHFIFEDVANLWATIGESGPILVFAGHTDVVPAGSESDWTYAPFSATEHKGYLYGRGAADMKGSLAAMITACERHLDQTQPTGRIGFLITSDEEGVAINGTVKVIEALSERGEHIDYCIVGEPSSTAEIGDVVKIGRRGSLNGLLHIKGLQGHVAYPQLAKNPIHEGVPALIELCQIQWDQGNAAFPPSSFQISNIKAGTGANNVIPESMSVAFNVRFSTEIDAESIQLQVQSVLDAHTLDYEIDWQLSGNPFLTSTGSLLNTVQESIQSVTGRQTSMSTSGGTSDGRFIASTGAEVIEIGPCNATIHKVDECVAIADLDTLSSIYQSIIQNLLSKGDS
jgi:succinyl-diaminopimelate desuccinylase